ncbi:Transposase [Mycetohabitans rhizoxinica HKI 454]|uniref:Transposase n=1 Tax=Mycetohabitans rhizoxinica (strain DSM 19002 / CIP 109453 / HKI 454) TaxID=882378 RepID=E5ARS3_MYCRK|nr:Transposase [Mycetohabitans rhizoxinica HKI 454]
MPSRRATPYALTQKACCENGNITAGKVVGELGRLYRSSEFLHLLRTIASVPVDMDGHLLMGNDGTHNTPSINIWFARHRRFPVHFTPISASWPRGAV